MTLSTHTDVSHIPQFPRTVTKRLPRTQNYYGFGLVFFDMFGLWQFQVGWNGYNLLEPLAKSSTRAASLFGRIKMTRVMSEVSSIGSTHRNNIARTSASWQQPSRSVLCFLSARSGRKGEKKNCPKAMKDRENIPPWNERTDVITHCRIPMLLSIIHPHLSLLSFLSLYSPWPIGRLQLIQTSSTALLAFSKSRNSSKIQLEQQKFLTWKCCWQKCSPAESKLA